MSVFFCTSERKVESNNRVIFVLRRSPVGVVPRPRPLLKIDDDGKLNRSGNLLNEAAYSFRENIFKSLISKKPDQRVFQGWTTFTRVPEGDDTPDPLGTRNSVDLGRKVARVRSL